MILAKQYKKNMTDMYCKVHFEFKVPRYYTPINWTFCQQLFQTNVQLFGFILR